MLVGEILQVVDHMKLLGLAIQNNLKWDIQVKYIVYRANRHLFMLYTLRKHAAPVQDMMDIFQIYIVHSSHFGVMHCAVWHPAFTNHQSQ